MFEVTEAQRAKDAALTYLSKTPATQARVREKLLKKEFSPEVIDEAIAALERVGLLDDEAYARAFAKQMADKETVGAQWIETKLRSRGVPSLMAARVAEEFAAEGSDDALQAARERIRRMGHVTDAEVVVRRVAGQLQRRGFGAGEAFEAARRAADERGEG